MADEKKHIYTYCTINKRNGKIYVGYHSTDNLNDGYIGCGVRSQAYAEGAKRYGLKSALIDAVCKYGYDSFDTVILDFHKTIEEAQSEERRIVDHNFVRRKDNYNISIGGRGGLPRGRTVDALLERSGEIAEVFDRGVTIDEASNILSIPYSTLRKFAFKYFPNRKALLPVVKNHGHNFEEMRARYKQGKTLEDISKEFNCYSGSVKKIVSGVIPDNKYIAISPDKQIIKFTCTNELPKEERLFNSGIIQCAKGKISNYKGWLFFFTHEWDGRTEIIRPRSKSTRAKGVKFIKPDGGVLEVKHSLTDFCKEYNFCYANVLRLKNGKLKIWKGIKLYEG